LHLNPALWQSIRCALALASLGMLVACGGGGGGSSAPPVTVPVAVVPDDDGADSSPTGEQPADVIEASPSGWLPNVFEPLSDFTALCESPRTDEADIQGTSTDENNWIRSMSNLTYLWYDEIEDVDPGTVDDPLDYFDLMRTFELSPSGNLKDKFHFTYDTEEWQQLSQSGVSGGYGATFSLISRTPPRKTVVAYTEPNTPATSAGVNLQRGAEILEVDGVDLVNASGTANIGVLNSGLFPDVGETHEFLVRDLGSDETRTITMQSQQITSVPVQNVGVIDTDSGKVGYLLFNDHIATAEAGLVNAVEQLSTEQVTDLVLDLRYNGGGFLAIANELAYMIAGPIAQGQTFDELQFNDKHEVFNPVTGRLLSPTTFYTATRGFSLSSGQPLPTLDLPRVFVLTGGGTCSASEAIINGLTGIDVEVIQIGNSTCGKPYGFYGLDNCGTTYFTIQFRGVNAKGFGDYTDGFSPVAEAGIPAGLPGCVVGDDFGHLLGDVNEARLAAALQYRDDASCPGDNSFARRATVNPLPDGEIVKPLWLQNMIVVQ
jgi:carboxyl-terminal processing protease